LPMFPNVMNFRRPDGLFGSIVPSGTRDPVFLANYPTIKLALIAYLTEAFPAAFERADFTITEADASNPAILLRTVDRDRERLELRHRQAIDSVLSVAAAKHSSRMDLDTPDAYEWSLYHLLQNEDVIRAMFPISYYRADGGDWKYEGEDRPRYFEIGERNHQGDLDNRTLSAIADHAPTGAPIGYSRLLDMATVIRSKDAGVNRLTFDIFFTSAENYEAALNSNLFTPENIAGIVGVAPAKIIGTYFVDACNAIKISVERPNISASVDERDMFGAQQQSVLEEMSIPFYATALARASSF
jgi:Domain of unknown function (DUF4387)